MFVKFVENGSGDREFRCSYHRVQDHRDEFDEEPKFQCPEDKCEEELNFAECFFSTCCHEAIKKCSSSSQQVTLAHFAEKIADQERLNKKIEEVAKKYQDDLEKGLQNLRNLIAARDRYRDFHNPTEVNEGKDRFFSQILKFIYQS